MPKPDPRPELYNPGTIRAYLQDPDLLSVPFEWKLSDQLIFEIGLTCWKFHGTQPYRLPEPATRLDWVCGLVEGWAGVQTSEPAVLLACGILQVPWREVYGKPGEYCLAMRRSCRQRGCVVASEAVLASFAEVFGVEFEVK